MSQNFTAEEVRAEAAEVADYGGTQAGLMLTAYADLLERIKADESGEFAECPICKGWSRRPPAHATQVQFPNGTFDGPIPDTAEPVAQGEATAHYPFPIESKVCPRCDGRGRTTAHAVPCVQCGGTGELS